WSDSFVRGWVGEAPQLATRSQHLSGAGQDALDQKLSLVGEWGDLHSGQTAMQPSERARAAPEELARLPKSPVPPAQRPSAARTACALDDTFASSASATHKYVFEKFGGLQLELVTDLTQTHPIRRRQDIEPYLTRLAAVPWFVGLG